MATYKLNAGYDDEKAIEAKQFVEQGSLIVFFSPAAEQVYAIPTNRVYSIEKVTSE